MPWALAPRDEHGGDPGKAAWGRGSSPYPLVTTYPSEKALAQLHPLRRLHAEHLPLLGLGSASPPRQKALPLALGPRRSPGSRSVLLPTLSSGAGRRLWSGAGSGSRTVTPGAPPFLSLRTRVRCARPQPRPQPASPPLAFARAAAHRPPRAVALRRARLPAAAAAAARAPTPAPACLGARAPGPGGDGGSSARVLTEARQCACACARTPKWEGDS